MKINPLHIVRLESIRISLEKIPKDKLNTPLKDMLWLTEQLHAAYILLEKKK